VTSRSWYSISQLTSHGIVQCPMVVICSNVADKTWSQHASAAVQSLRMGCIANVWRAAGDTKLYSL